MTHGIHWTFQHIDELRRLAGEGLPCIEIAERIGRSIDAVYSMARRHGIHLKRDDKIKVPAMAWDRMDASYKGRRYEDVVFKTVEAA